MNKKIIWSELDKRIVPLVRFLTDNGIVTIQSCEGHKVIGGGCLVFPHLPWVEITRKSFYENFSGLENRLNPPHPTYGRVSLGSLNKKYNSYLHRWQYFIVFWNLPCMKSFIK